MKIYYPKRITQNLWIADAFLMRNFWFVGLGTVLFGGMIISGGHGDIFTGLFTTQGVILSGFSIIGLIDAFLPHKEFKSDPDSPLYKYYF